MSSRVAWKLQGCEQEADAADGGGVRRLPVLLAPKSWRARLQERHKHPLLVYAPPAHPSRRVATVSAEGNQRWNGTHLVLLPDRQHLF